METGLGQAGDVAVDSCSAQDGDGSPQRPPWNPAAPAVDAAAATAPLNLTEDGKWRQSGGSREEAGGRRRLAPQP